jgi:hypothetical protein
VEELSDDLMRNFAYNAMGDLVPMQAIIGGITAQEVMKVILLEIFCKPFVGLSNQTNNRPISRIICSVQWKPSIGIGIGEHFFQLNLIST